MKRPSVIPVHAGMLAEPVVDPGRRRVLKLMAASAALAGTGCSQPPTEKIMPYVNMPEGMVPGDPVFYATTLLRGGYGMGVLVETESGRPIKIEGNTGHPASLGAADAQAQAAILTLWDPERSRTVMHEQQLSTWPALLGAVGQRMQVAAETGGAGLHLLTGPLSSPTLLAQIGEVLARFPRARWHVHDPADSGPRAEAARHVFRRPARSLYRLDRARIVLSMDADLFGPGADGVRNAHDFMRARRESPRARMYAVESSPGLCGAVADRRYALSPADMETMLGAMAMRIEAAQIPAHPSTASAAAAPAAAWLDKLCEQLLAAKGACVVASGHSLSGRAHILAWRINQLLGNIGRTVMAVAQEMPPDSPALANADSPGPTDPTPRYPANLVELATAMHRGQVATLVMVDVNPAYDAPRSLDFDEALRRVPLSVHMGLYRDETAHSATWHVPMTHELEAWSDARSYDGTASIVQPVIAPLYGGRSPHTFLNVLATGQTRGAHDRVRATWRSLWKDASEQAFERRWESALRRGIVDEAPHAEELSPVADAFTDLATTTDRAEKNADDLIAVFANDSNLVTGEYANNAWLQELPRPYTKITWDNAALISPATAREHGVQNGDVVSLAAEGTALPLLAPVWLLPGQADGVITLALGYGRPHAGSTARGHGFDAYMLQDVRDGIPKRTRAVRMQATGERHEFACTQHEMTLQGRGHTVTRVQRRAADRPAPSLYPEQQYDSYAWGMTVDLDACIGCNACTVACQAENNIPVVGPEEVARGREMHWIRIDLYRNEEAGRTQFQPMACQHCENAPCEVVCPVGATMHDSEGLNVQVYNRCVGTRFCSNNCPYKVRHFNFFQYSETDPSAAAHANPDVTVRQRGVMEKCTYCVQRISHARIQAQKSGRRIRDGDIVTACEATCPTHAITFGDINDPDSRVSHNKASPRNYAVLEELNTRPRTTYLARIDNPAAHPEDSDD